LSGKTVKMVSMIPSEGLTRLCTRSSAAKAFIVLSSIGSLVGACGSKSPPDSAINGDGGTFQPGPPDSAVARTNDGATDDDGGTSVGIGPSDAGQGPESTATLDGPEDSAPDDAASTGEGLRDSAPDDAASTGLHDSASTDAEAPPLEAGVDGALEDAAIWACPATACTTCGSGGNSHNLNNNPWAGSLTLFISYSADTKTQTVNKGYTPAEWNAAVNSFDVSSFATQVRATGAKNILLMLGQNTGYYNSPNSVYETYAGVQPGTRCSTRDLPMEIADALAPMGIGMYLYLPEDVGWGDTNAAKNFGLAALAESNWVVDTTSPPSGTPSSRRGRIGTGRKCGDGSSTDTSPRGGSRRPWPRRIATPAWQTILAVSSRSTEPMAIR
jgi:hypothetical protein